jgi:hypothetical protein
MLHKYKLNLIKEAKLAKTLPVGSVILMPITIAVIGILC